MQFGLKFKLQFGLKYKE